MAMMETRWHNAEAQPLKIVKIDNGKAIEVVWNYDEISHIQSDTLWKNCPSAAGRRRRIDGRNYPQCSELRVTDVKPVGLYAVNLVFSDGHDRGIYPWSLLRELAAKPHANDFIIYDEPA